MLGNKSIMKKPPAILLTGERLGHYGHLNDPMSSLIYECSEKMGEFEWETKVFASTNKKEVSITQTWLENSNVMAKQAIIMTTEELQNIIDRLKSKE